MSEPAGSPSDPLGPVKALHDWGVGGGLLMIVIAGAWFIGGWIEGYIFIYPPFLALLGIFTVLNGLYARKRMPPPRRRRRTRAGARSTARRRR